MVTAQGVLKCGPLDVGERDQRHTFNTKLGHQQPEMRGMGGEVISEKEKEWWKWWSMIFRWLWKDEGMDRMVHRAGPQWAGPITGECLQKQ